MEKKYELTKIAGNFFGETLHRIRALKDFCDVEKGDIGGWVESEDNLSQEGTCWVYDNAKVIANARISDNVRVADNVLVCGNAHVIGYAKVLENAVVGGNAEVSGDAEISGNTIVGDNEHVDPVSSSKKIKFTKEEKEEFDDLLGGLNNGEYTIYQVLNEIIPSIDCYSTPRYSKLYRRLFYNSTTAEDNKNQIEFIRVIEHPELIEMSDRISKMNNAKD